MNATQLPAFGSFTAEVAKSNDVVIPADRRSDFTAAASYFDGMPNTTVLNAPLPDVKAAELFAQQVKQFGRETNRATFPKVDGTTVKFRFAKVAKPRAPKQPVTVTQIAS